MYRQVDEERERQRRETGREDDFLFCCFHEAGHAIVAEAVAPGSAWSLRVWADGAGFSGEMLHEDIDKSKRASALVAVAGEVAERLFSSGNEDWRRRQYELGNRPSSGHDVRIRRSDGDEDRLTAYLQARGWHYWHEGRKDETYQLQREARAILLENWDAFARLGEAVIAARAGQGGASLQRDAIIAAMEGRPVAHKAAAPAERVAPATSGREMTLPELVELRAQAQRDGHDYLARLLDQHIGWRQGNSRGRGGPIETAAYGNPMRRGGR